VKRIVLLAPFPHIQLEVRRELGLPGVRVAWHRLWTGVLREHEADAVVVFGPDPIDVAALIRRVTASPLLVVGGSPAEGATCLDLGADAWLPRDAPMRLVAAQLRSLLREEPRRAPGPGVIEAGGLRLDMQARRAHVSGQELGLAPREFELLRVLAAHLGQALSRDQILAAGWGPRFVGEPKTVDVHVAWLRQKLEGSGLRVTTIRGIGYRLDVLGAPADAGHLAGSADASASPEPNRAT